MPYGMAVYVVICFHFSNFDVLETTANLVASTAERL